MGPAGQGRRGERLRAINGAAVPLAGEIQSFQHLAPYMPGRYAAVLAADVSVTAAKNLGTEPSVRIRAKGRTHRRKVIRLNDGFLTHPLFGAREHWFTQGPAAGGLRPRFFFDPGGKPAPGLKGKVLAAVAETAEKSTSSWPINST